MSAAAYKVFLHAFCGKRQIQPQYEYEEDGDEFYCEVRAKHQQPYSFIKRKVTLPWY